MYSTVSILAFSVGCSAALGFFFLGYQQGLRVQMIYSSLALYIFAGIGVAAHLLDN